MAFKYSMRRRWKIQYEFWPYWIFYIPAYFYGLYLALKSRSFTYFTAVNPCMKYSGVFGYSKFEIMKNIPRKYLPKTILIDEKITNEAFLEQIHIKKMKFPLIVKPEIGERGIGVELLDNEKDLWEHIKLLLSHSRCLVQEFIDLDMELGILYYQFPNQSQRGIISITSKELYAVVGDGIHTLEQIIGCDKRIRHRRSYLKNKLKEKWISVIPKDKKMVIEYIGNHNRGTKFSNVNELASDKIMTVLDHVLKHLPNFHYGRLDLKVKSLQSFLKDEDMKVIEINGVNSESMHIYDQNHTLKQSYRDIFKQMKIIYEISKQNRALGVSTANVSRFLKDLRLHLSSRSVLK